MLNINSNFNDTWHDITLKLYHPVTYYYNVGNIIRQVCIPHKIILCRFSRACIKQIESHNMNIALLSLVRTVWVLRCIKALAWKNSTAFLIHYSTVINHTADGVNLYDALGVDNIMVGTESNGDRAFKIQDVESGWCNSFFMLDVSSANKSSE